MQIEKLNNLCFNPVETNILLQRLVLDQKDVQPLFDAIENRNLNRFSKLLEEIDINSYYKDGLDEDGEKTLLSMALLNMCFYCGTKSFVQRIVANNPNIDLTTGYSPSS
jgi:hypothetical protein